jgi:hypothetical protein
MRFAIVFSMLLMACASAPEERSTPDVTVEDHIPLPGNSGPGPNPCGKTYVIEFTTDAGTYRKEIPVYCNPNADPLWDPVDYREGVNPDIWNDPARIIEVNPQQPSP